PKGGPWKRWSMARRRHRSCPSATAFASRCSTTMAHRSSVPSTSSSSTRARPEHWRGRGGGAPRQPNSRKGGAQRGPRGRAEGGGHMAAEGEASGSGSEGGNGNGNGALCLHSYWRSSAAYRVRIGLNLKGLKYDIAPVHLVRGGGEQHAADFAGLNPQDLVPVLQHGHRNLRQSLAILEYLDEMWPEPPLLPATARDRARVRALAQVVACEIHPLNNLRVLQYLEHDWGVPQPERESWVRHWIE